MPSHRKRLPLQLKVTVVLVAIVMVPLGVAAYLVDQLGKTAANVASSDASARVVAMEQAIDTVLADPKSRTRDLGGTMACDAFAKAVAGVVKG